MDGCQLNASYLFDLEPKDHCSRNGTRPARLETANSGMEIPKALAYRPSNRRSVAPDVPRRHAGVVELVDAPDSKSGSERSVGSIPTARTIFKLSYFFILPTDPDQRGAGSFWAL
jgi:hypothetical protein